MADAMRAMFRAIPKESVAKAFAHGIEREFPGIHAIGEVDVHDDRDHNSLRIGGHFAIPGFWTVGPLSYQGHIAATTIEVALGSAPSADRTSPLAVAYPDRVRYEAEVDLHFEMSATPDGAHIETKAFSFDYAGTPAARHLSYAFDFTSRAPAVSAADLAEYARAVTEVRANLYPGIAYSVPEPDGPNWLFIGLLALLAAACAWGGRWAYLYNPGLASIGRADPRWLGIRGWLALLCINVLVAPLGCGYEASAWIRMLASRRTWIALTSQGPLGTSFVVGEAVLGLAFTVYALAIVVIFVRRR
jgi:hypothetical protein